MKKIASLSVIIALTGGFTFAQNLQKIPLTQKIGILNGKAFFNFPSTAKEEARASSIMVAPKNNNEESRIIYDDGDKRVVFFAKELFKIGDKNLFDDVKKGTGEILTYDRKILTDKDSIYSVLSTPTKTNTEGSGMLVNSLVVKVQDGTLFKILAYISPEAYAQKEDYMKFTESVFATLSKGNRKINLNARVQNIQLEMGVYQYKIDLPKNYSYTVDQAYDFKVTKITKYNGYNDDDLTIVIYSGNHPSYFYRQFGFKYPGTIVKGTFLKQEIDWNYYDNENKKIFLKERAIDLSENEMIHIAMIGANKDDINELTKIVENIKLSK